MFFSSPLILMFADLLGRALVGENSFEKAIYNFGTVGFVSQPRFLGVVGQKTRFDQDAGTAYILQHEESGELDSAVVGFRGGDEMPLYLVGQSDVLLVMIVACQLDLPRFSLRGGGFPRRSHAIRLYAGRRLAGG